MKKDILRFSSPAEAGVSPRAVTAFLDDVADRGFAMHGFLFLRHGKVFAEGYYAPFKRTSRTGCIRSAKPSSPWRSAP